MKRIIVLVLGLSLIVSAVALSSVKRFNAELQIGVEDRNPWNHLRLNNAPEDFQFAIVSDRTGGHREKIFSMAVEQLNLMQPEFVVSVGDLIEGYTEEPVKLATEWREFQSFVQKLEMPFFYVPGNHDLANLYQDAEWKSKFGRRYYHFVYRDTLFLAVCSEDPPKQAPANISADQLAYFKKVLDDNKDVRWTLVFLHKPMWVYRDVEKTGWLEMEKLLADRQYTVFAGHVHRYQKFIRNGRNYYQLATTGGGSKLRGTSYGEFDHIVWCTMKKDGPVLANVMLDGILPEDLKKPITVEPGVLALERRSTQTVRGKLYYEGTPAPNAYLVFESKPEPGKRAVRADAFAEADGSFAMSTYTAFDGVPAGEYNVTVVWRKPFYTEAGQAGPNLLPDRYAKAATSGLTATVKSGVNEMIFELKK